MIATIHFPHDQHPPFEVDIPDIPERNSSFYVDESIPGGLGPKKPYYVKYVNYSVDEGYRITVRIQLESSYVSM